MLNIVISILSTIQQRPVNKDNLTWNFPNPNAFIAWTTVNVSVNKFIISEKIFNKIDKFILIIIIYYIIYLITYIFKLKKEKIMCYKLFTYNIFYIVCNTTYIDLICVYDKSTNSNIV